MRRSSRLAVDRSRSVAVLVSGLACLALAGEARPTSVDLPEPPARDFTDRAACPVVGIPAGNILTVQLDGKETAVRLIGLFVPKSGSDADVAQPYLARLLKGESVYVEYEPDWPLRDREDRTWAYVYRVPDGLFVNLELIRLGYARISALGPFEHQELLRAYERLARQNRKGLWDPEAAKAAQREATSQPVAQAAEAQPEEKPASSDSVTVYVTEHGRKYHRADCPHVRGKGTPLALEEAKAKGYTPCSHCKPPE